MHHMAHAEKSLEDYRCSITLARNYHLDQNEKTAQAVVVQYNNYAWVLWNKCGSEEAIIHYGRALELLEDYLFSGIIDKETTLQELKHVGTALLQIYSDTSKNKEWLQLMMRLTKDGVEF